MFLDLPLCLFLHLTCSRLLQARIPKLLEVLRSYPALHTNGKIMVRVVQCRDGREEMGRLRIGRKVAIWLGKCATWILPLALLMPKSPVDHRYSPIALTWADTCSLESSFYSLLKPPRPLFFACPVIDKIISALVLRRGKNSRRILQRTLSRAHALSTVIRGTWSHR